MYNEYKNESASILKASASQSSVKFQRSLRKAASERCAQLERELKRCKADQIRQALSFRWADAQAMKADNRVKMEVDLAMRQIEDY